MIDLAIVRATCARVQTNLHHQSAKTPKCKYLESCKRYFANLYVQLLLIICHCNYTVLTRSILLYFITIQTYSDYKLCSGS